MIRFNPLGRSHYVWRYSSSSLSRALTKKIRMVRFQTTKTPPPTAKKPTGIKALMKEYGYSALGVYLGLTAIDLPICYLLVHSMGKEEIQFYENKIKQTFGYGVSDEELRKQQEINKKQEESEKKPDEEDEQSTSLLHRFLSAFSWTEFAIAYGIHKSLIFIRLPITAAITPSIVKILRGWGFKIGSQSIGSHAAIAKSNVKDYTAANPKFGVKPDRKKKWFDWFF